MLEAHGIEQRVAWLQLDLSILLETPAQVPRAHAISRFPSSDIDLAFALDESIPAAEVHASILRVASRLPDTGAVLVAAQLFDVFRSEQVGQGRKSLAYRLTFQAPDRTLTDAEVASARAAIIAEIESSHAATLRA